MKDLLIRPQKTPLQGTIEIPGDKSISHRAIMLASLAEGVSHIRKWLPAGDTLATLEAFQAMGVKIEIEKTSAIAWDLTIEGKGLRGLKQPKKPIDCKNAGTCMRLIAGILAGQKFSTELDGSEQLRKRPMTRITNPLTEMGAKITSQEGYAPLHISPNKIKGIDYELPMASAQVKSAVLLAGLFADGDTRIKEPGPARDHTERMLTAMGVQVLNDEAGWLTLKKPLTDTLLPLDITVPGDISSAAFPLVAACIVPHSEITIKNVGFNSTRTGILEMLQAMGAEFAVSNKRVTGGETAVDLSISFNELHAHQFDGDIVVRGIDEFPILAVASTQAAGQTIVRDAKELRVKEVDRISVMLGELRKFGIAFQEFEDGFAIDGPLNLYGTEVNSHDDHRLGMSLAVAGLATHGLTRVVNGDCIGDSFPGFVETMQALGANIEWIASEETNENA